MNVQTQVFHARPNMVFSIPHHECGDNEISRLIMRLARRYCLIAFLLCQATGVMAGESAQATVESLHEQLLASMKAGEEAGFKARYSVLEKTVLAEFDFESIARIVVGRDWKELPEERRQDFLRTFSSLSVATYASRFSGFSGESFVIDEVDTKKEDQAYVRSRLVKSDGSSVSLDYMVQAREGNWQILNVIAEGISDLSLKRSEYRSIIKNDGFDALLKALEEKIADYYSKQ